MAKPKKKKIKIPKAVLDLRLSPKKFAKKYNIRLKGKGMKKKERKHNYQRLRSEYSEHAISGLNKAVKILAENPDAKKIDKVKKGVDNIISKPEVMKQVAKLYRKNPKQYQNLIYLPNMIMNTIAYYSSDAISDEEKEIAKEMDVEGMIKFCEKILKSETKRYMRMGLSQEVSYQLACVIPTTKLFKNSRQWYKQLINQMYVIAEAFEVDIDATLRAVYKIDKKKNRAVTRKEFLEGFFSEFILQKNSNKVAKFTEYQKELHEGLIDHCLLYLDGLKGRQLRDILKTYIKRRKTAESYKNDSKRVIKFTDHANSNSPYTTIKKVVQELIADNSSNELYLQ